MLRTLVVLLVLALAGFGLARLTGHAVKVADRATTDAPPPAASPATFELLLSAAAKSVALEAGGAAVVRASPAGPLAGNLEIPDKHPVIFLKVEWADTTPGHRFAKLRLDRPGEQTLEHVFSAPGDIDDIWEP